MARKHKTSIDFRQVKAAMDEALNVQIDTVERDTMIKGETETWLEVTYQGQHIGWLPTTTSPQVAMNTARRWLMERRLIAKADNTRGTGRVLFAHLDGGMA